MITLVNTILRWSVGKFILERNEIESKTKTNNKEIELKENIM